MPRNVLDEWDSLINRPHGILLVTGPTGSGKSTTLYASLKRIVSDEVKAITVEDPVEYHVPGVNQIQVNHKVGLDLPPAFAPSSATTRCVTADPHKETAETAIQDVTGTWF